MSMSDYTSEDIDRIATALLAYFSKTREGEKRKFVHVGSEERGFWRQMARIALDNLPSAVPSGPVARSWRHNIPRGGKRPSDAS